MQISRLPSPEVEVEEVEDYEYDGWYDDEEAPEIDDYWGEDMK